MRLAVQPRRSRASGAAERLVVVGDSDPEALRPLRSKQTHDPGAEIPGEPELGVTRKLHRGAGPVRRVGACGIIGVRWMIADRW